MFRSQSGGLSFTCKVFIKSDRTQNTMARDRRVIRPVMLTFLSVFKCFLKHRQWDFHTGGTRGQDTAGPLGGVRSGPQVEEMLAAMESWSGLLLHYRYTNIFESR